MGKALDFLLPWDAQPQEAVGVDWGNPVTKDLVFAASGSSRVNAVDGKLPTLTGNGLVTRTSAGGGVDLDTTAASRVAWALPSIVQTTCTLLTLCTRRSAASTFQLISLHSKTQGSTNANYIEISSGSNRPVAGTAASGSFNTVEGTSFGFVQLNTAYVFVGRYLPTERAIFGNGTLLNTSVVARSPLNADEVCIGSLYDDSSNAYAGVANGLVMLAAAWGRALTDQEIAEVSANPWQLFAPRSIWVPVSAATSGAYTLIADAAAFTLAAQDATLIRSRIVTADAASFAVAAQDATLLRGRVVTADASSFALAAQDATLTHATPGVYTLTCDAAQFNISAQSAELTYSGAAVARRHAGGYKQRKGYLIKGRRYFLSDDELAVHIAHMLQEVSRGEVKEITAGKPKVISKRTWDAIKPMERLNALSDMLATETIAEDDDEETLLMLM